MSDGRWSFRGATRGESRRLAVLALCAVALVLAAFAFPGSLASPDAPSSGSNGNGGGNGGSGGSGGGSGGNGGTGGSDGSSGGSGGSGGGSAGGGTGGGGTGGSGGGGSGEGVEIVIEPGGGGGDGDSLSREQVTEIDVPGCVVVLGEDPTPGARVPVYVLHGGEPAAGVPVRFDGESIGTTDAGGRVVGTVPYSRSLDVSVSIEGVDSCRFETPASLSEDGAAAAVRGPDSTLGLGASVQGPGIGSTSTTRSQRTVLQAGSTFETLLAGRQSDPSGTVAVDGSVSISVRGETYPGETVTVVASIDGVPMRHATVSVDGTVVGETNARGEYDLRLPDDGSERVRVAVERGDFAESGTIDVATLDVALESDALLTVPGQSVTARVTVDGEPAAGARVAVGSDRVGTTDATGRVEFNAPLDPTESVGAWHRGLSAHTPVWPLYVPLVVAIGLSLVAIAGVAWRYGRRRGVLAAGAIGATGFVYAAYRLDGRRGLLLALGVVAVLGVGVWSVSNRRRVVGGAADTRDSLTAFVEWLAATALGAVRAIERGLAGGRRLIQRFATWLAGTPRSVGGIVAAVGAAVVRFVRAIPSRVAGAIRALVGLPWTVLAWIREVRRRSSTERIDGSDAATAVTGHSATSSDAPDEPDPISLREAWRRFARRVAARDWRRRTPGEVARAALDQGLPRDSVLELTSVFRDVEYGDRPPSEERVERAREAFRRIESDQRPDREASD